MKTQKAIDKKQGKARYTILALMITIFAVSAGLANAQNRSDPPNLPKGVEYYINEGHDHLPEGQRSFYTTDPPTSGPHSARWLPPGVYQLEETRPELLVHNLEHGNIVVYFNPDTLPKADIAWLTKLTKQYVGQWDGMLMVTYKDKKHPLILSAWRANLRLDGLEKKRVMGFVDYFRGRGPENAVR